MMRRSAAHYTRSLLLFVLLFLSDIAVAEIYKWVDAQGNIHFGDKPKDPVEADDAEEVHLGTSYQPTVRTPQEQQAYDEQQRKLRLTEQMHARDAQAAKQEIQAQRGREKEALCATYEADIEELETVKVKDGVRYLVYASEDGKPVSSERQREMIAQLKQEKRDAGCQ